MAEPAQDPQMSIGEIPLEDQEILDAIREWLMAKDRVTAAQDTLKDRYQVMQGIVGERDLDEGTYRIGECVLMISTVAAHQRLRPKLAKTK
jgi:hypothetical protein